MRLHNCSVDVAHSHNRNASNVQYRCKEAKMEAYPAAMCKEACRMVASLDCKGTVESGVMCFALYIGHVSHRKGLRYFLVGDFL